MGGLGKGIFLIAGLICLDFGIAGIRLAHGSARLGIRFEKTGLYRDHVLPLRLGRGMALRSKITSFAAIALPLGLGSYMMRGTPARWILVAARDE